MTGRYTPRLILAALIVAGCAASPGIATARATGLTDWTDRELVPHLAGQLADHPRFEGETVVFVALDAGAPAPVTNELVLAVRERLVDALHDTPGITIGWQTERNGMRRDDAGIDCMRNTVHYYIGLEAARLIDGRHRISMRVLDAEDESWVTGTGKSWEGRLTSAQRRAFEQASTDEYFRGERDVPFSAAQTDMLAAYLAHDLTCKLLRQTAGEYIIAAPAPAVAALAPMATPLAGTIELVGNNLAGMPSLQITSHAATANAFLEGKAHHIDDDLYQYWATVTPGNGSAQPPAISASAYVRLPAAAAPGIVSVDTGTLTEPQTNAALLAPLRIVEPRQRRACYRAGSSQWRQQLVTADYTVRRGECFLLQTRANGDATIFLLNYQVSHGLVRLAGAQCRPATQSISARAGQQLQFPGAGDQRPSASAWQGQQGLESFYVVAVDDRDAARELGTLIDGLPTRCTLSAADGLNGNELQNWLGAFGKVVDRWRDHVDWQAVRIEHVY